VIESVSKGKNVLIRNGDPGHKCGAKWKADEVEAASVNMVFILPMEFKAPLDDIEKVVVQFLLDLVEATFEKPEDREHKHLKPLLLKGYVNGKPMTKMLVNIGAAVNLMSYAAFRKLGLGEEDLVQTNMILTDFEGDVSPARGVR